MLQKLKLDVSDQVDCISIPPRTRHDPSSGIIIDDDHDSVSADSTAQYRYAGDLVLDVRYDEFKTVSSLPQASHLMNNLYQISLES